jgi:hypothetical protein
MQVDNKMYDERSARVIVVEDEKRSDKVLAVLSMVYLLFMVGLFLWGMFDVWVGRYTVVRLLGYGSDLELKRLEEPIFRLLAYAFLGGGVGGAVNGIRSLLTWHVEWGAFQQRYVWKYVTWPWLGTALALIVFALVRSGLAVVGGEMAPTDSDLRQSLSTLVIGILSGYGAREVFIWLDMQVSNLFKISSAQAREVPDLFGLTRADAEQMLRSEELALGEVKEVETKEEDKVGKVVEQFPESKKKLQAGSPVSITLGSRIQGDGYTG